MTRPFLLAAALLTASPAFADDLPSESYRIASAPVAATDYRIDREATRKAAMRYEVAYLILSAVDTVQTARCFKRDASCVELNPFQSRKMSVEKVVISKVVGGVIHFALVNEMAKRNPKFALRIAQLSVGVQGGAVLFNLSSDF